MTGEQRQEAEALVRRMLELIGDDPERQGLKDTPARVVRSWTELFGGYSEDPADLVRTFDTTYDQIVVCEGIDYFSTCEHHLLPFHGHAHVAYLPQEKGRVLGLSKMVRIVQVYARRLQIQEQMTEQIAEAIQSAIDPKGVAVVVEGQHLCMMARGVKQAHATMKTSCLLGAFRDDMAARAEVLSLLGVR